MAHVRIGSAGEVIAASLVGGSRLRQGSADRFAIEAEGEVRDLAFSRDTTGVVDLCASAHVPRVRLVVSTGQVSDVRVNDQQAQFERAGAFVVVDAGQPVSAQETAPAGVAGHGRED
jgi:hypothetical protein